MKRNILLTQKPMSVIIEKGKDGGVRGGGGGTRRQGGEHDVADGVCMLAGWRDVGGRGEREV